MVKLTLEYNENKLDKCLVTVDGITYKTELLHQWEYIYYYSNALRYLATEAKSNLYNKILKYKCLYIEVPVNLYTEIYYIQTDVKEIAENDFYDSVEILTVDLRKFYKLYIDLYSEYITNYSYMDINNIFICPDDLKIICDIDEIPNTKFDVHIDNIHIHYIPSINKSFVIDDYSLKR